MKSPYLTVIESCDFPDIEIKCSESVTFGETARNKMKDKRKKDVERDCILNGVCALLNSGGGVLSLLIANSSYDYKKEGRGLDIEQHLQDLVGTHLEDMIEFIPHGDKVYIYVKSWDPCEHRPRLCSINSGLWERAGSFDDRIRPSAVSEFLKKRKDKAERNQKENECPIEAKRYKILPGKDKIRQNAMEFYKRNTVNVGESLEFGESIHVEFKQFGSEKLKTRLKEVVPKNISAFANTDGGFMFIGVDDKLQKVIGCGKGLSAEELLGMVREVCKYEAVHSPGCSEVNGGWSPECKLIKVITEKSSEAEGYVVAIKIPVFCCAVFEKPPNSWHIDGGSVYSLSTDKWLEKMQLSDPDDDLSKRFENVLSLQNAPPQCKPVYSIQKLSSLQERLFPVSRSDIRVVPETFINKPFTSVVLSTNSVKSPGICMFSHSWAVDIGIPSNEDVICEALIISTDTYPTLCCVVERASPDLWKYAINTAFHLKQKLVNLGGFIGKLCVIPQLVETQSMSVMNLPIIYPNSYRLNQEKDMKALLRSLVIVLMSFTSLLSDEVGCEFLNLLTEEQFAIIQTFDRIKNLFIHGVPGSGKTLIAMELIRRIKNAHHCDGKNILYLCENVGLRDFMRNQNLCQCETRVKFMLEHMDFSEVKHIIVDEAQNFRAEKGEKSWYEKALQLRGVGGMFWIFLDYNQKCQSFPDGLPPLSHQSTCVLHKVVRNSAKVLEAMQGQMDRIMKGPQSEITKHLAEINSQMELNHSFQGMYRKYTVAPNKEVDSVINILHFLFSQGHSAGDIAVLFSTQEELTAVEVKLINTSLFQTSSVQDINPNKMVLDTVRRFTGLERNIVILVNPSVHGFLVDVEANFLVSAYSRARIRLYDVRSR